MPLHLHVEYVLTFASQSLKLTISNDAEFQLFLYTGLKTPELFLFAIIIAGRNQNDNDNGGEYGSSFDPLGPFFWRISVARWTRHYERQYLKKYQQTIANSSVGR